MPCSRGVTANRTSFRRKCSSTFEKAFYSYLSKSSPVARIRFGAASALLQHSTTKSPAWRAISHPRRATSWSSGLLARSESGHASSGPQRLPDWNKNAGGIKAFYFKDPDEHPVEILQFPEGKGDPKWQRASDRLFLGIDHTAIVVSVGGDCHHRDPCWLAVAGVEPGQTESDKRRLPQQSETTPPWVHPLR